MAAMNHRRPVCDVTKHVVSAADRNWDVTDRTRAGVVRMPELHVFTTRTLAGDVIIERHGTGLVLRRSSKLKLLPLRFIGSSPRLPDLYLFKKHNRCNQLLYRQQRPNIVPGRQLIVRSSRPMISKSLSQQSMS